MVDNDADDSEHEPHPAKKGKPPPAVLEWRNLCIKLTVAVKRESITPARKAPFFPELRLPSSFGTSTERRLLGDYEVPKDARPIASPNNTSAHRLKSFNTLSRPPVKATPARPRPCDRTTRPAEDKISKLQAQVSRLHKEDRELKLQVATANGLNGEYRKLKTQVAELKEELYVQKAHARIYKAKLKKRENVMQAALELVDLSPRVGWRRREEATDELREVIDEYYESDDDE